MIEPKKPPGVDTDEDIPMAERWKIDRHIPVALLCAFALQTGTAIWWASSINSRVDTIERQLLLNAPQGDRLTRVEVKLDALADAIKDVKDFLRSKVTVDH